MTRPRTLAVLSVAALVAGGCTLHKDLGGIETEGGTGDSEGADASADGESMTSAGSDPDGGTGGDETGGDDGSLPFDPGSPSDAVDILFVVDNSGTMGEEEHRLASAIFELTEPLQQAGIRYRIAVTSSDNGNPWCDGTGPERGAFVTSSCHQRLQDFVFNGAEPVDATQPSCLDVCALPEIELAPTATSVDPNPAPRPWVEWNAPDDLNTPGLATSMVLSCTLPTGINGCGFEQPLESMLLALQRSADPGAAEFGFARPDAHLLVVLVTDEVDCSVPSEHETIFLPHGDRTFWSDPEAAAPSSAVCWNAGVQCPGISPYETCTPVDLAADGTPAASAADAVLHPVSRYVNLLKGLAASKTAGRVRVMAIAGRSSNGGAFVYADSTGSTQFESDFGIGPGCEGSGGAAVPPVRIRAVVNATGDVPDAGVFSVCESDYAPALSQIADTIISWAP